MTVLTARRMRLISAIVLFLIVSPQSSFGVEPYQIQKVKQQTPGFIGCGMIFFFIGAMVPFMDPMNVPPPSDILPPHRTYWQKAKEMQGSSKVLVAIFGAAGGVTMFASIWRLSRPQDFIEAGDIGGPDRD
jgi:hypothetical protein